MPTESKDSKKKTGRAKRRARFFRVFLARKAIVICLVFLILMVLAAIFAPVIAPYDPYKQDLRNMLKPMSWAHLLGTDSMGRDVFSRIIYGTRVSLIVGLSAVAIAGSIGMLLGLISGTVGGVVDSVIMRIMDAMMSVPMIILALFLGSILGKGLFNVTLAVGLSMIPSYTRLTRGQVLTVRQMDYVTAGTISGASKLKNALYHVFPNCVSPNIVLMTMNLGTAILNEAALSFLGLGINPPTASWGGMVSDGYNYLKMLPVIAIAPGVFIVVIVLCFNMVGDALRDALDPRLRGAL
jgi:peptide/nickel transport system permease protein